MSDHPFCKASAIPIAILLVLLASALIAQLSAAPTSRTFLLRVCNKAESHSSVVNLASASLTPDLRVIGWVLIPTSRCVDVGQFQKPGVYLHAMSGESTELAGQGPCCASIPMRNSTILLSWITTHHAPRTAYPSNLCCWNCPICKSTALRLRSSDAPTLLKPSQTSRQS